MRFRREATHGSDRTYLTAPSIRSYSSGGAEYCSVESCLSIRVTRSSKRPAAERPIATTASSTAPTNCTTAPFMIPSFLVDDRCDRWTTIGLHRSRESPERWDDELQER